MPSTPTRGLSVTYGSLTVNPDATAHQIHIDLRPDAFDLDFAFNVVGATANAFATACLAAENAFRTPFQDLTVTQDGESRSFKPSDNTGLETRATIAKMEHPANTGLSRHYVVRISGGIPADLFPTSGLREFSVSVGYSPARRRMVTISGVFTAVGATAARAGYEAAITGICTTALSGLSPALAVGANCQLVGEDPTATSYNNKTLSFSRMFHETIYAQATSAVREQTLTISTREWSERNAPAGITIGGPASGAGETGVAITTQGRARPFNEINATYEAYVDKAVTSGGPTAALVAQWSAILPWIVNIMQSVLAGGAFTVVSRSPSFNFDDNRISGSVSALQVPTGITVLRREYSIAARDNRGQVFVPAWDGNDASCFVYRGPRIYTTTTTIMEESVTGGGNASHPQGGSVDISSEFLNFLSGVATKSASVTRGSSNTPAATPAPSALAQASSSDTAPPPTAITTEIDPITELFEIGLDAPIAITRTTRVMTTRYVKLIAPIGAYTKTGTA